MMNARSFVSIHDTQSSDDMSRIDLVYMTVAALNDLSSSGKFEVEIEFTDGVKVVDPEVAKYAETFIRKI